MKIKKKSSWWSKFYSVFLLRLRIYIIWKIIPDSSRVQHFVSHKMSNKLFYPRLK